MILTQSNRPLIIAGPCSAESREQVLESARKVAQNPAVTVLRAGVWKPRTRPGGFEGIGDQSLQWLQEAKELTKLKIATEIATPKHLEAVLSSNIDMLWIGARTVANPFSVQELADSLRGVKVDIMIKNPPSADIALWAGAVERIGATISGDIGLIHRGFSSYNSAPYRNSPLWHLALEIREIFPSLPLICDPSHIAGDSTLVAKISQEAANLNYSGLMVECHPTPNCALSDAKQQLSPEELTQLLKTIDWPSQHATTEDYNEELSQLRSKIDTLDSELLWILSRRMETTSQIGELKARNNVAILQSQRWEEITNRLQNSAQLYGLSEDFMMRLLRIIHAHSIELQQQILRDKDQK